MQKFKNCVVFSRVLKITFRSRDVMTSYNGETFRFFPGIFVILGKHLNESTLIKINSIEAVSVFKIRSPALEKSNVMNKANLNLSKCF